MSAKSKFGAELPVFHRVPESCSKRTNFETCSVEIRSDYRRVLERLDPIRSTSFVSFVHSVCVVLHVEVCCAHKKTHTNTSDVVIGSHTTHLLHAQFYVVMENVGLKDLVRLLSSQFPTV